MGSVIFASAGIFIVVIFILGILAFFKGVSDVNKINAAIAQVGTYRNNESALAFAECIANIGIQNQPATYNQLRAAWGIVKDAPHISKEVKEKVKVTLQMRGVVLR